MRLMLEGKNTEQERLALISRHRDSTLDEIHFKQAQLDRLDYLRYKIQTTAQTKTVEIIGLIRLLPDAES